VSSHPTCGQPVTHSSWSDRKVASDFMSDGRRRAMDTGHKVRHYAVSATTQPNSVSDEAGRGAQTPVHSIPEYESHPDHLCTYSNRGSIASTDYCASSSQVTTRKMTTRIEPGRSVPVE
jgi:hypothetical protein